MHMHPPMHVIITSSSAQSGERSRPIATSVPVCLSVCSHISIMRHKLQQTLGAIKTCTRINTVVTSHDVLLNKSVPINNLS